MKRKSMSTVYLAAVSYSVITGLSFLFGKIGLEYSNPLDLLAYRFSAGFLGISIPILFKWITLDINMKMLGKILPLTLFYPLAFFAFQTYGLQYIQSSEAGILLALLPVFTMILADYFLNEKTTTLQKISVLLSVSGAVYISYKKSTSLEFDNIKGIILMLISILSFAIYSVMARKLTQEFKSIELSFIMISVSLIAFNVLALGRHILSGDIMSFFSPVKDLRFIMAVFYLGVLSSFVTSFLSNYVLSKIESSKMSVFINLSTVISILAGMVFLKEEIFYYHIIGSFLIILGVMGVNFLDKESLSRYRQ